MARCDKHDIDNCADCTGVTKKHQESLREPTSWEMQQEQGSVPFIPGGTTIWARFPGNCAGCGTRYEAKALIFAAHGSSEWIAECCIPLEI